MARHSGQSGVIKAVTTGGSVAAVGEVKNFNLNITAETIEGTAIGDTWKETFPGIKSWEVSLTCNYDPSDAPQADLIEAEEVDLELLFQGDTSTYEKFTGTGTVTSVAVTLSETDVTTYEVTVSGKGALTRGTVT